MNILLQLGASGEEARPDVDWLLGLGVALLIAGATAAWASLHLRGKTYARLNSSVDLAFVRLTDRAIIELRLLRDHLDTVLPTKSDGSEDDDEPFEPLSLIVDPSSVEKPAKRGIRVLKERHVIHRQFDAILVMCSLLKVAAILFILLVALSTVFYYFAFNNFILWVSFCAATGVVAFAAVVLVCSYAWLDSRIQKSIEDSQRNERPVGASQ